MPSLGFFNAVGPKPLRSLFWFYSLVFEMNTFFIIKSIITHFIEYNNHRNESQPLYLVLICEL